MRNDEDDDDLDSDEPDPIEFPRFVMAAGIIWIGIGSLTLLNALLSFGNPGANQQAGNNPSFPCCIALIGVAFLYCGNQTVRGLATDTLGNAMGSLLLGLFEVLVGGVMLAGGGGGVIGAGKNNARGAEAEIAGTILWIQGEALVLAAIFALAGRRNYLDWREENTRGSWGLRRRRRKRVVEEDDEDEDRPRRRRTRRDDDE